MFPDQFNSQLGFGGLSGLSLPYSSPLGTTSMTSPSVSPGVQAAITGSESTTGVTTPAVDSNAATPAAAGGFLSGIGGLEGLAQITKGIGSIGQIYTALQGLKLAKEQFAFSKDAYNTNMANQTKSYNTALTDRANARAVMQNQDQASAQAYIDQNRL